MNTTMPQPEPIRVACVGDGSDPVTGKPACGAKGSGSDPDPAAPTGIIVVAS